MFSGAGCAHFRSIPRRLGLVWTGLSLGFLVLIVRDPVRARSFARGRTSPVCSAPARAPRL
jgi:hypothetical protein